MVSLLCFTTENISLRYMLEKAIQLKIDDELKEL